MGSVCHGIFVKDRVGQEGRKGRSSDFLSDDNFMRVVVETENVRTKSGD